MGTETIKPILEKLYYLSGSLLFVVAIYQIRLLIRENKYKLAYSALDLDKHFKKEVLKLYNDFWGLFSANGLGDNIYELEECKSLDKRMIEKYEALLNENFDDIINYLDLLESYAFKVHCRIVNEKLLFKCNAKQYFDCVKQISIIVYILRTKENQQAYSQIFSLYNKWKKIRDKQYIIHKILSMVWKK